MSISAACSEHRHNGCQGLVLDGTLGNQCTCYCHTVTDHRPVKTTLNLAIRAAVNKAFVMQLPREDIAATIARALDEIGYDADIKVRT